MVSIQPISHALVPRDSDATKQISAQNYDEFQSDREVWEILQKQPESLLRVTMPHCHVASPREFLTDGSQLALEHAAAQMTRLADHSLVRKVENLLWIYEITSPQRPELPQWGLGGCGRTAEIRTDQNPSGSIVRNEGIHPDKMLGRAKLLTAIQCDTGFVNLAVRDKAGVLLRALELTGASRPCDFETVDEGGNRHRVWLVTDAKEIATWQKLLAEESAAYVADGNHRSAAAAHLGCEQFMTVFFPASRMGLEPYNRLLPPPPFPRDEFLRRLAAHFEVEPLPGSETRHGYRPPQTHTLGMYLPGQWYRLRVRPTAFDPTDAADAIDAQIVQRHLIAGLYGFDDARNKKINYVGGNKDAAYLQSRVDSGDYGCALSLAPVTMDQFVAVCEQNKFMPPKSTWFDPKIRTGLVMSLLRK